MKYKNRVLGELMTERPSSQFLNAINMKFPNLRKSEDESPLALLIFDEIWTIILSLPNNSGIPSNNDTYVKLQKDFLLSVKLLNPLVPKLQINLILLFSIAKITNKSRNLQP